MSTHRLLRALGLEARSIQNPAVPLTSEAVLAYFQAEGGPTEAGPVVSTQGALAYTMVLACTKVLAQAVSALPLMAYRRTGEDEEGRERAADVPAYRLLHRQPNPDMTPATWKETLQGHLCTWGNAYARTLFDGAGRPVASYPLLPHETAVKRVQGSLDLRYTSKWQGRDVVLDPIEVLHVPGLGFDGLVGYSPVGMARQGIGLGLAAEQFAARFYRNGAWLGGVFEHPMALSDKAHGHLKDSLLNRTGAVNAHKPLVLEEGMKWHQATMPAEDAMFLAMRKFQNREVCALFRVPPHMVADLEGGASYASVEQLSLEFVTYALGPWLVKWEQEVTRKLLDPDAQGELFAEFMVDALLRGDTTVRFAAYRTGRDGGFLTVNEIRRRENLPEVEGGDELLRPLNMGVVGQDPEPDPQDPTEPGPGELDPTAPPVPGAPPGSATPQPSGPPEPPAARLVTVGQRAALRALVADVAGGRRELLPAAATARQLVGLTMAEALDLLAPAADAAQGLPPTQRLEAVVTVPAGAAGHLDELEELAEQAVGARDRARASRPQRLEATLVLPPGAIRVENPPSPPRRLVLDRGDGKPPLIAHVET